MVMVSPNLQLFNKKEFYPFLKAKIQLPLRMGTGKTATFAISLLQLIDPGNSKCQALVLAPTRELA